MVTPLQDPADITPQWLNGRLRENGHLPTGEVLRIEVGKTFKNRAGLFVAFKAVFSTPPPPALYDTLILRFLPQDRLADTRLEIKFYQQFASQLENPPVMRIYDYQANSTCGHLLMEDLSSTHKENRNPRYSLEEYADLVEGLLKFHIHFWEHPQLKERSLRYHHGPLRLGIAATPSSIRTQCAQLQKKFTRFRKEHQGAIIDEHFDLCQRVIEAWPNLFIPRVQTGKGLTLLHGDYHFGNVFLPNPPLTRDVAILDWECAQSGIGTFDLAYLLVHSHHSQQRRDFEHSLLKLYHNNLRYYGIEDYSWEECLYDYQLGLLATLFVPVHWNTPRAFKHPINACHDWACHELLS